MAGVPIVRLADRSSSGKRVGIASGAAVECDRRKRREACDAERVVAAAVGCQRFRTLGR